MQNRVKHIIWDWNGTLLFDTPITHACANRILIKHGKLPVSLEDYRKAYRHPISEMYRVMGLNLDNNLQALDIFNDWHLDYQSKLFNNEAQLREGCIDILDFIKKRSITQSVLSALEHQLLLKSVTYFSISNYFQHILGLSDQKGDCKRNNGSKLIKSLEAEQKSVILVGDSSHDAEVASYLGIYCVLISNGSEDTERLLKNQVPVVNNLNELKNYI